MSDLKGSKAGRRLDVWLLVEPSSNKWKMDGFFRLDEVLWTIDSIGGCQKDGRTRIDGHLRKRVGTLPSPLAS